MLLFRRLLDVALRGRWGRGRYCRRKSIHTITEELEGSLGLLLEDQLYGCSSLDLFSKGAVLKALVPHMVIKGGGTVSKKRCLVGSLQAIVRVFERNNETLALPLPLFSLGGGGCSSMCSHHEALCCHGLKSRRVNQA